MAEEWPVNPPVSVSCTLPPHRRYPGLDWVPRASPRRTHTQRLSTHSSQLRRDSYFQVTESLTISILQRETNEGNKKFIRNNIKQKKKKNINQILLNPHAASGCPRDAATSRVGPGSAWSWRQCHAHPRPHTHLPRPCVTTPSPRSPLPHSPQRSRQEVPFKRFCC